MWGPMGFDGDISGLPAICKETAARGFDGIETNPVLLRDNTDAARRIIEDHGLKFLSRAHTFGKTVEHHLDWVRRCVDASHAFGSPHVIVQSGADYFDDGEIDAYFTATAKIEADSGLRLAHETHRGCILYSPWVTARVLDRFPEIWLASDYSHFVIVAERYLETEGDLLARFAPRTIHIDARVSTFESPQVADPRTGRFLTFWDEIHAAGALETVVPEFGPDPYAPKDSADLDDICQWMAEHLRARWS
jgi:sugar phosphate isomerase/epimerase